MHGKADVRRMEKLMSDVLIQHKHAQYEEVVQPAEETAFWKVEGEVAELYNSVYWPKLKGFVLRSLQAERQSCPVSFEELYSYVYKCMHCHHTEKLYKDLIELVTAHVLQLSVELANIIQHDHSLENKCIYIQRFHAALKLYGRALQGIVPIFNYLNRAYVASVYDTTLEDQLLDLFKQIVVARQAETLIGAMKEAKQVPFSVDPSIMAELAVALYSMNTELRYTEADFFALYIPNAKLSSTFNDLQKDIEEANQLQFHLQDQSMFRRSNCNKRSCDDVLKEDKECSNSLLSSMLSGHGS